MTSEPESAAARRARIAAALDYTESLPEWGPRILRRLEEPLNDTLHGDRIVVHQRGSGPIILVKRPFWSIEDGQRHYGLFDPERDGTSDLPFRTSKVVSTDPL